MELRCFDLLKKKKKKTFMCINFPFTVELFVKRSLYIVLECLLWKQYTTYLCLIKIETTGEQRICELLKT